MFLNHRRDAPGYSLYWSSGGVLTAVDKKPAFLHCVRGSLRGIFPDAHWGIWPSKGDSDTAPTPCPIGFRPCGSHRLGHHGGLCPPRLHGSAPAGRQTTQSLNLLEKSIVFRLGRSRGAMAARSAAWSDPTCREPLNPGGSGTASPLKQKQFTAFRPVSGAFRLSQNRTRRLQQTRGEPRRGCPCAIPSQ